MEELTIIQRDPQPPVSKALAENIARVQVLVMQALSDGQADLEEIPSLQELCKDIDQALTENIAQCAACLQELGQAPDEELDELFDELYSYLEEFIALKLILQSMPLEGEEQKLAKLLVTLVEIPLFNLSYFLQEVLLRYLDPFARPEGIPWGEPELFFDFERLEAQAELIKKEFAHLLDDMVFQFTITEQ